MRRCQPAAVRIFLEGFSADFLGAASFLELEACGFFLKKREIMSGYLPLISSVVGKSTFVNKIL